MADWIVGGILLFVIGAAGRYIYKAKKSGVQCIGCSSAKNCSGHCGGCGKKESGR